VGTGERADATEVETRSAFSDQDAIGILVVRELEGFRKRGGLESANSRRPDFLDSTGERRADPGLGIHDQYGGGKPHRGQKTSNRRDFPTALEPEAFIETNVYKDRAARSRRRKLFSSMRKIPWSSRGTIVLKPAIDELRV
jgi:hypothetical protein